MQHSNLCLSSIAIPTMVRGHRDTHTHEKMSPRSRLSLGACTQLLKQVVIRIEQFVAATNFQKSRDAMLT